MCKVVFCKVSTSEILLNSLPAKALLEKSRMEKPSTRLPPKVQAHQDALKRQVEGVVVNGNF
jgi:hypothetical protein